MRDFQGRLLYMLSLVQDHPRNDRPGIERNPIPHPYVHIPVDSVDEWLHIVSLNGLSLIYHILVEKSKGTSPRNNN